MLREIHDFNSFLVVSRPDGTVTTTLPSRKRGSTDGSQAEPVPLPQASRERGKNINLVLSAPQKAPFCNEIGDFEPKYLPWHQAGPPGVVLCHDKGLRDLWDLLMCVKYLENQILFLELVGKDR